MNPAPPVMSTFPRLTVRRLTGSPGGARDKRTRALYSCPVATAPTGASGGERILFVLPFPPRLDAEHGGRVIAALVARMAVRHPVAVVCIRREEDGPADETLRAACEALEVVVAPAQYGGGVWRNRMRQVRKLRGATPSAVSVASVPGFAERLRAVAEDFRPTVVEFEPHEMAQYLPALDGLPAKRIVVEHDPGVQAARDFAATAQGPVRLMRELDVLAWERYARRTAARADAFVTFTERDRTLVASYGDVPVRVIPFGGDLPDEAADPAGTDPPAILFVGGYRHVPNADAALRLQRAILPAVRRRHPEATLELVGADPTPAMREAAGPGTTLHGRVASVRTHLERAAVVAVPIRLGGGMRVKVLEALAAGKAVVASPLAVAGLDVVDGRDFLLAETQDEFAEAICALLGDRERRIALGRAARAWAEEHLGWGAIVEAYEQLYRELGR
jgi:glycosyltransferase involved in cell wall biosynthesis